MRCSFAHTVQAGKKSVPFLWLGSIVNFVIFVYVTHHRIHSPTQHESGRKKYEIQDSLHSKKLGICYRKWMDYVATGWVCLTT